uniref:Teneurin NHL domain-containing protein n=1 Tax=Kalanchoe fedtschenkoi TaxID=63787 RepID=A0A7N0ULZ8_KALFE
MGRSVFILGLTVLLLSGGVSSAPSTNSPARILNGVFSNAASMLMKWLWSLKTTSTRTVNVHRPMMKFESGYSVETVFDGSKLGVEPHSVQVLQSGELLILDSQNSNLYRISTPLSLYSRPKLVAGSPEGSSGHVDGRPREAKLNHPKGVAVDDKGNIYIADTGNSAIRKITESGVATIVGGRSGRGGGHVDGPGEDAKLSNDFDVAYVGSSCSLLVVDRGNKAIREIQLRFDDCAYQYGSGFPFGIGVVVAAGVLGYALAMVQRKPGSAADSKTPQHRKVASEAQEGLLSRLGSLVAAAGANAAEILSRFIPGFVKKPRSGNQPDDVQRQHQEHSTAWPTQQESFEIPADEEPPPPALDTRAPTPKKTYAFMSRDSEKMNQIRQSHVFYNGWDNAEQPPRIQQATLDSQAWNHDKKSSKEQERPRRKKSVPKPEDHRAASRDVEPRINFSRYEF